MTLIDEHEVMYEQERKRKIIKIIVRAIIFLLIFAIILLVYVSIKKNKTFKLKIDENPIKAEDSLLLKDDKGKILIENGEIYISIQKLSTMLNCQYYNSEYKKKGEDKTKCQVRIENQYTSYIADSNKIYKAIVTETEIDNNNVQEFEKNIVYEYFTIDNSIRYINDELYASSQAIELGLDILVSYDSKKNTLSIHTLDHLEELAKQKRSDTLSSTEYEYINKRLLKYGMCIVRDSEGNLGVGSYTNQEKLNSYVASCKYSSIKFNEAMKTFEVITNSDNKKCILYVNLNTQETIKTMATQYSDIQCITNNFDYFLIKDNDKYGIINGEGKTILYPIFDQIGIDESLYTDVFCKYIVKDKYIPVKQNGLWGLYGIDGKKLIEPQFQDIGCTLAQSGESVTIIPNVKELNDGIVFLYNKEKALYGVYNAQTGEKLAISLIEVFKKNENGNDNYYISYIIDRSNSIVHTINIHTDL